MVAAAEMRIFMPVAVPEELVVAEREILDMVFRALLILVAVVVDPVGMVLHLPVETEVPVLWLFVIIY